MEFSLVRGMWPECELFTDHDEFCRALKTDIWAHILG